MAAKKLSVRDATFEAKGKKLDSVIDDMEEEIKMSITSYDPHELTEIIIKYGLILTGVPLYSYQSEPAYRIIYSVVAFEGSTITMLFSRQSGKTETLAFVVNSLCTLLPTLAKVFPELEQFRNGFHVGLFAPQSDQVWTTYNRALLRIQSENAEKVLADPDLDVSLEKVHRYSLSNGSTLTGQTASVKSKIEGKTYHLILCEEAQDLDSFLVQKSIEPMVTATGGSIVKCGTTGTEKNDFWYEIQFNKNKSRKEKDPRLAYHWEYNYKKIIAAKRAQYEKDGKLFHLHYEKDVKKKIERWGVDSQSFKLSFALQWDLESGMLITDEDFNKLCNRRKGFAEIEKNDIIVAGLDIGKEEASTVLTIGKLVWHPSDEEAMPKLEIVAWIELHKIDYETQHHILVNALVEYQVESLYLDYTGVGKAVGDRLIFACGEYINITPYTFSKESKSEMWFNLVDYIQRKGLIIPANNTVKETSEFQNFEEQMKNCLKYFDGPYLVCHKSDGYRDDYVDSLALMCMAPNFEVSEQVEVEVFNPFFEGQQGLRDLRKRISW